MKTKKRVLTTKKVIARELKHKRAQTKCYWYICAINRETKEKWFWDFTDCEWCGYPLKECCGVGCWDDAFNLGICFGIPGDALRENDVYIVHGGYAEWVSITDGDEPYPTGKYITRREK